MAQSQVTQVELEKIKLFFKFEGGAFNPKNNVKVHERPITAAELASWNHMRSSAEEVALDRRIGEYPGGAYQQFTTKAGVTGKVGVKDPGGKASRPAQYAKVFNIPAGTIFPIVDRAGNPMPDMVYEQLDSDWDVVGTGTLEPTVIEDAISYANRKRLANATLIAEARKRQADLAVEMEAKLVAVSDEDGAKALLLSWGHSVEAIASITI